MAVKKVWALGVACCAWSGAGAAQAPAVEQLSAVRVQADPLASLPGSARVSRDVLQQNAISDWRDIGLEVDPALHYNEQRKSINVRGMDQNRLNVRVDGIRIPWLDDGARGEKGGFDAIDFDDLSAVDLVRGAGASRSGSLVGYLDLQTLDPADILKPGRELGALLRTSWDGSDEGLGLNAALAARAGERTRWMLLASQRRGHEPKNQGRHGGLGASRDRLNPEDYTQRNYAFKLQHDLNAEHSLGLSGTFFQRDADVDSRREQGPGTGYDEGRNQTDKRSERQRLVVDYVYQGNGEKQSLQSASLKFYWQKAEQEGVQHGWRNQDARGNIIPRDPFQYRYPYGYFSRGNLVRESGHGLVAEASGHTPFGIWRAGGEALLSRARQYSSGQDNCPPANPFLPAPFGPRACEFLHTNQSDMPLVKGEQWSLWGEHEFQFAQGAYSLTPSLRLDSWRFQAHSNTDYQSNPNAGIPSLATKADDQRLSPALMAQWHAASDLSFYARYGYGYTAPTASQLYLNYGAPGTYLRAGNPELKPEISRGWELGGQWGDDRKGVRLSVFHNNYKNFIESEVVIDPDSPQWNPAWTGRYPMGVTAVANKARVQIYGAELAGHWMLTPQWRLRSGLSWARGKDRDSGLPINSVAPLGGMAALAYLQPRWGAELALHASAKRERVEDPARDFQTPGFGVWNLKAWWEPQQVDGLRVQIGVYNLFDKYYWNPLDVPRAGGRDSWPVAAYTSPGRYARLNLAYQF
ncbi:TonB-dependent hemoglobin/transferrin/lactoferrin family receptor [Alcaligenes sp. WGS1538]|uniref:TonB-dependent hemoglobin/transferrin/lactoferrin family receptor n=1 Tax=Alcaligenes sp. WGS1538 TaxID=3366811 RepID=UPI00372D012B